jgi:hypothetical protein
MSSDASIQASPACPNCGGSGAARFCPHCGQKQGTGVPGVRDYLRELASDYIAADGKLWRTLALLIARPGMLGTEYLAGRRQRYIGPLKLYLGVSVVFFLLASLLPVAALRVSTDHSLSDSGRREVEAEVRDAPAPMQKLLERVIEESQQPPAHGPRLGQQIGEQLGAQAPRALFLLLPVFAALTRLAFRRRPERYPTHLMLALHAHAMAFLLLIAQLALPFAATANLILLMPLWLLLAFRRAFGGRWWALALRALLVSGVYAVLLLGTVVAGVLLLATTLS